MNDHEAKVKIASGLVFILVVPWTVEDVEDVELQGDQIYQM